ncbi:hypothetical protein [Rhodobacter lacus]|uniref:Uncharacterized protein n=1 Tax=Rhodobacter lacus TaxID=1641972 RepID=A0ABW5A630_9RHOB
MKAISVAARRGAVALRVAALIAGGISALPGSAVAEVPNAEFCRQYAANTASVVGAGLRYNPSCLDEGRGVHDDYQMHYNWCMRNSAETVRGAEAHIRDLVFECTSGAVGGQPAMAPPVFAPPAQIPGAAPGLTGQSFAMPMQTPVPVPLPIPVPVPIPVPAAPGGGQPYVIYGTCSLQVDGQMLVNLQGTCPIWMANDGTGGFWVNADRNSYLGDYFAQLEPSGNGFASGHWNGARGATHAQGWLGDDFRMGSGGCWSNARATICAAR